MDTDPAKARFFILMAVRLFGAISALLGIAIIMKQLIEPSVIIGGLLILIGAFDVMVVPQILARRWKSPPQT